MDCRQRLFAFIIVVTLAAAGWASALPTLASASVATVSKGKVGMGAVTAPVSSTGHLPPAQLVRFIPTTNGTAPVPLQPILVRSM